MKFRLPWQKPALPDPEELTRLRARNQREQARRQADAAKREARERKKRCAREVQFFLSRMRAKITSTSDPDLRSWEIHYCPQYSDRLPNGFLAELQAKLQGTSWQVGAMNPPFKAEYGKIIYYFHLDLVVPEEGTGNLPIASHYHPSAENLPTPSQDPDQIPVLD